MAEILDGGRGGWAPCGCDGRSGRRGGMRLATRSVFHVAGRRPGGGCEARRAGRQRTRGIQRLQLCRPAGAGAPAAHRAASAICTASAAAAGRAERAAAALGCAPGNPSGARAAGRRAAASPPSRASPEPAAAAGRPAAHLRRPGGVMRWDAGCRRRAGFGCNMRGSRAAALSWMPVRGRRARYIRPVPHPRAAKTHSARAPPSQQRQEAATRGGVRGAGCPRTGGIPQGRARAP
jgi:hypothetical protein